MDGTVLSLAIVKGTVTTMKKRIWFGGVFLLLLLSSSLLLHVYEAHGAAPAADDPGYESLSVLTRALQLIRQDYVDEKKVSYHDLTYAALRGMLNALDPHSQFMDPQDFKGMQDETKSQFGGLGIIVSMKDDKVTIVTPMEDTPGFNAGLLPNDQILKINGISTEKMEINDAIAQLRGDAGQKVTLNIYRPSTKEYKDYVIERAIIKVASVKGAKLLDPSLAGDFKIGYLRITQFNDPTAQDLSKRLDELEAKGMKALVLDLRSNPGGLLKSAVDVCGEFVPPGTLVVSTEGRAASQERTYRTAETGKQRPRFPMAILINWQSASGAEIVAGALKDLNRAILVGETTFGKGSVQSVIQLQDGSAMRLTTAKYYTPSKQVIHEKGVSPNIESILTPEQERALYVQRREESLTDADQKDPGGFRDTQLERAVDALKGVMIYAEKTAPAKDAHPPAKSTEKPG